MARRKDVFEVIEEIVKDFERRMEQMKDEMDFEDEPKKSHKTSFSIRISQNTGGVPEVVVQKYDDGKRESKKIKIEPSPQTQQRKVKEYSDPKTAIIRRKNNLILEVELPGVKRGDIEIFQLRKSVEVRAYKGDHGFFAIFPVPRNYQVLKDEFSQGKYRIFVQV